MNLKVSLSARDLEALSSSVLALPAFTAEIPTALEVDARERKPTADWRERWVPGCKRYVEACWGPRPEFSLVDADQFIWVQRVEPVRFGLPFSDDVQEVLRLLVALPFEQAAFWQLYEKWGPKDYEYPRFHGTHYPLGWACAFRGVGHDTLVSRRWLDFGPWRVLRGPGDTTLVQFHELGVDPATALEQAASGHALMGQSRGGGGMVGGYGFVTITGEYWPAERLFEIHVREPREITSQEINEALCIRTDRHHEHKDCPVERVAYVFASPDLAEPHLHVLWLRELEVWALRDGHKVRLDLDYVPALPPRPAWVQRLDAADAARGFPPPAPFWPEVTALLAAEAAARAAAPAIALPDPGPWTLRFRSTWDEDIIHEDRQVLARKLGASIELDESLEWRQVSIVLDADRISGRLHIRHLAVNPSTRALDIEHSAGKVVRQLKRYGKLMVKVRKVWNDFVAWMGGEPHVNPFPSDTAGNEAWESFRRFVNEVDEQYQRFAAAPLTDNDAEVLFGYIEQAEWLLRERSPALLGAMRHGEYVAGTRDVELN
jgi:hypothetical protein